MRFWSHWKGGAAVIGFAAIAGCAVSVANYFNPQSGIAGEPGTILVIASTFLLALFAWLMIDDQRRGGFLRAFVIVSSLLNIIGTAFAAYLLHSWFLLGFMALAALGLLVHMVWPRHTTG